MLPFSAVYSACLCSDQ